jgi:uncharacterized protein (TIGR02246 family)
MRLTTLAAAAVLLGGPAVAQDKATIEKLNDAFEAAFNKADFAALANMYTEDAYLLPPGSELAKGRSNVQAFWTKAGEAVSDLKLTTVDVKAARRRRRPGGRDILPDDQRPATPASSREIRRRMAEGRKRVEARDGHLEH